MSQLTPEEITTVTNLLQKLEPGFLPLEIFNHVARLTRLSIIHAVPLRWEGSRLQVGLVQRPADDLWWPSLWHLPGTVLRSTDTLESALQRLWDDELRVETADAPRFRDFLLHHSQRGAELVLIHTIENCAVKATSPMKWFPMDAIPDNFIESEWNILNKIKAA